MPALICLSPVLADQCFPRGKEELSRVLTALGTITEFAQEEKIQIAHTDIFRDFLIDFNWSSSGSEGMNEKRTIHQHLSTLFTSGNYTIYVDLEGIEGHHPHPLPRGCDHPEGFQEMWAEEIGKLLVKHDQSNPQGKFFIGVACDFAFSEQPVNTYPEDAPARRFPLVGPETCNCESPDAVVEDSYGYNIPIEIKTADVSLAKTKENISVLGGQLFKPDGDSHYKVQFSGSRPWTFSKNDDPVPLRYLRELRHPTGLPLDGIKYALIKGERPPKQFRLK